MLTITFPLTKCVSGLMLAGMIRWFPLRDERVIELLFNFERVWDSVFWINEGIKEQEEPVFGACGYLRGWREALGYDALTDEQLAKWELKTIHDA